MNWQHLLYFKEIVESKSFSKAADALFITPSALSKAIRSLENEIGVPLFEKQGRSSVLTKYGKEFYPKVCVALETINDGLIQIKNEISEQDGHVNISGIYTVCSDYLSAMFKQFNEIYPNITFTISYDMSGIILEQILNGEIDLGFCGDFNINDEKFKEIEFQIIKKEELMIVVPTDHPLAGKKYVDAKDLKHEKFIMWKNAKTGLGGILLDFCNANNIDPQISYEVYSDHTILQMVSNGLGIALMPNDSYLMRADVSVLKLKENAPYRTIHMVWKKNHYLSPAAILFKDYILDSIPSTI